MAITSAVCNTAKQQFLTGSHTPQHTYKIALYQSPASLDASTTVYTATQEVTGSGYTGGGQVLSGYNPGMASGVGYLDWTSDPSWASATFTARGCMIYNTSGSASLAVFDFGADYTATNGTFTITLPAPGTAAAIRVS